MPRSFFKRIISDCKSLIVIFIFFKMQMSAQTLAQMYIKKQQP